MSLVESELRRTIEGRHEVSSPPGPPYPPKYASLGGTPTKLPDVPVCACLLLIFLLCAAEHMRIFTRNNATKHKFVFNGALFGFCTIRVATMSLRIAWTYYTRAAKLVIAAQVFVYAGTIILFLINWFFAQRVIRAQHPRWGWSIPYRMFHILGVVFLFASLGALLVAAIQQVLTLDPEIRHVDRIMQLTGQTYFAAFCLGPVILVIISVVLPRTQTDKFGQGRLRANIMILFIAAVFLATGAIFRAVILWQPQIPLRDEDGRPLHLPKPWYYSKACFYTFNFATEIVVVILFALFRVDIRFHVPNGSHGPGGYRVGRNTYYQDKDPLRFCTAPPSVLQFNDAAGDDEEKGAEIHSDRRPGSSNSDNDSGTGKLVAEAPAIIPPKRYRDSVLSDSDVSSLRPLPRRANWPLPESQNRPAGAIPVLEHRNRRSQPSLRPSSSSSSGSASRSNYNDRVTSHSPIDTRQQARYERPFLDSTDKRGSDLDNLSTTATVGTRSHRHSSLTIPRGFSTRFAHDYTAPPRSSSLSRRQSTVVYRAGNSTTQRRASPPATRIWGSSSLRDSTASESFPGSLRPPVFAQDPRNKDLPATPSEKLRQCLREVSAAVEKQVVDRHEAEQEFRRFDYSASDRGSVAGSVAAESGVLGRSGLVGGLLGTQQGGGLGARETDTEMETQSEYEDDSSEYETGTDTEMETETETGTEGGMETEVETAVGGDTYDVRSDDGGNGAVAGQPPPDNSDDDGSKTETEDRR